MRIFTKIILTALLAALTINLFACEDNDGELYTETEEIVSESESATDGVTESDSSETTDTDGQNMGAIGRF